MAHIICNHLLYWKHHSYVLFSVMTSFLPNNEALYEASFLLAGQWMGIP